MGHGFTLKCKMCDYEQRLLLGVGIQQMQASFGLLEEMRNGVYGEAFVEKADAEGAEAELSRELVVCSACGAFEVVDGLSLYVTNDELDRDVLAESEHRCPRCEARMERAVSHHDLRCPRCRGELQASGMILWD